MRARLTLHFPDAPARQLYLDEGETYVLGRNPASDIVIDSSQVSRRHASIAFRDDSWAIEDLGSKNGVAVDGAAISRATLTGACWISLGELLIRFELRTDEQAQAEQSNRRRRFETSLELRRSLGPSAGADSLLRKVLTSVIKLAGMQRGFAMLARADGELEIITTIGAEPNDEGAFRGSVGAINRALETQRSVVSMDVQQFAPLADRPSIIAGRIRALVCLPMSIADRTIGSVYADSTEPARVLTELDLEILEGLIAHATTAIALAQLDREIVDINSVLKGKIDVESISDWRDKVPGYRAPVAHSQQPPATTARVTWSRVAGGN